MKRRVAVHFLLLATVACGADADSTPGGEGEEAAPTGEAPATPGDTPPSPAVVVQGGTDIWIAVLTGDGTADLRLEEAANQTDRPDRYDNQPQFLPDGSGLLYTAGDAEGRTDIHLLRLPEGRSEQLTRTAVESEFSPTPLAEGGFSVIRVEADGTQRLWRFAPDGTDPSLLLPDLAPVGYQGWIDSERVALFVLGEPATLQVADVRTGETRLVFEGIGPSVQAIPGREAVSFVEVAEEGGWIREYEGATDSTHRIAPLPEEAAGDHAWTPGGALLATAGGRVLAWDPGGSEWREVGAPGPAGVTWTRIAVSPDGTQVALVGQRGGE